MLDIKITRTTCPKEKPQDESKLGFGKKFTDHMFVMDYTEGEGWHDARIVPYAPFQLDPATVVFHYAQEIFEGMKAYRTADDTIQLFPHLQLCFANSAAQIIQGRGGRIGDLLLAEAVGFVSGQSAARIRLPRPPNRGCDASAVHSEKKPEIHSSS